MKSGFGSKFSYSLEATIERPPKTNEKSTMVHSSHTDAFLAIVQSKSHGQPTLPENRRP